MEKRKTAGELSLQVGADNTKYDSLEIGHALTQDIQKELEICVNRHIDILDEDVWCVGYLLSKHQSLQNVMVRNFFATLYLPKPRPNQTIFLYERRYHKITKRLWALPNAATMAELSTMTSVDPAYKNMKYWSDAFFKGWKYDKSEQAMINHTPSHFFNIIRLQHGITLESEKEYLDAHRSELIKACGNQTESLVANSLEPLEILGKKIVHTEAPILHKNILNGSGQTQDLYRKISR